MQRGRPLPITQMGERVVRLQIYDSNGVKGGHPCQCTKCGAKWKAPFLIKPPFSLYLDHLQSPPPPFHHNYLSFLQHPLPIHHILVISATPPPLFIIFESSVTALFPIHYMLVISTYNIHPPSPLHHISVISATPPPPPPPPPLASFFGHTCNPPPPPTPSIIFWSYLQKLPYPFHYT